MALARTTPRDAPDTPARRPSPPPLPPTLSARPPCMSVRWDSTQPRIVVCPAACPTARLYHSGVGGHGGSLNPCLTAWWIASHRIHRRDAALDMTNTVQ